MNDNKINIGVVGVGKLGTYHVQKLQKNDLCNLIGVYDSDEGSMDRCEQNYGVETFKDITLLLDKCQAITIATPTITHYNVAKEALEKGLHVFIEKPITDNIDDAIKISDIAKKNNRLVQVGHIERFNNAFKESLEFISKPQFIEIHRISPFPNRSLDIPVVMDVMIHDLDILLSINKGNPIKKIHATGASVVTDFIDLANARIEFENGLVANLTASRISSKQMRKIRIFQDKSYIGIDLSAKKLDVYKINNDKDDFIDVKSIDVKEEDALESELSHFIGCIINNDIPLVSANDGIDALKLAVKIEELIKEGRLI